MRFHQGYELQRGRGFGSILAGLFRSFMPIAKAGINAGKRVLQSDYVRNLSSKTLDVGKEMLKNIATDVLDGQPLKKSAKDEINKAKKKISEVIKGSGKGCRKRKCKVALLNGRKKLKFNLLNE
jgi:hypothetical protein